MGILQWLKEAAEINHNLKIRILLPKSKDESSSSGSDSGVHSNNSSLTVNQTLKEELDTVYPNQIDLRLVEESMPIRITIVVIDRKECMITELKDDTKDDSFHAAGLSVYSNSNTIALSYSSIFESLWIQTETYEKLKAYSKMQTEFINTAAHELRTPLQPILGISEILRFGGELDRIDNKKEELNKYLDIIIRNARRSRDLADNILNASLIESKSLKLEKEIFNLNDIITDNIEKVKRQFLLIDNNNSSSLKIIYDPSSGALSSSSAPSHIYVEADKYRLSQVVYNLLTNAIKFTTKDGTITISVKTRKEEGEEKEKADDNKVIVVVSVKDTGKGIDSEIFPRLFTKFATKSFDGMGLGLFISRKIIEAHGGRIWAENNPDGIGATFYFTLPVIN
jgi:signal transduction histidine kinase